MNNSDIGTLYPPYPQNPDDWEILEDDYNQTDYDDDEYDEWVEREKERQEQANITSVMQEMGQNQGVKAPCNHGHTFFDSLRHATICISCGQVVD